MMDDGGGAGGTGDGGGRRLSAPSVPGYEISDLLGRGGFGMVYRAWQPAFARQVAIKVLLDTLDDRDSARLLRECRALGAASSHPNIVTVHDAGFTEDGRGFLVMEYLSGGSLSDRLARDGMLAWRDVTRIGIRLAGALETAHRAGVLHRDIKPDNVLLSDYGEPKLADFGIARLAAGTAARTGPVYASILYAAPEVLAGGAPSSPASDVYALGGTLLTLLTGRPPFVPGTDEPVGAFIGRIVSTPPDLRVPDVPVGLLAVLGRALAKEPGARQASAEELGEALREVEQEAEIPVTSMAIGTPAPPDGRPPVVTPPPPAPARRRRTLPPSEWARILVFGTMASAVALIAILSTFGTLDRRDRPSPAAGRPGPTTTIVPAAAATTTPSVAVDKVRTVPAVPAAARCAASISYGETVACSIGAPGAVQRHDFTGSAGDHVYLRASRLSGDFSLVPSATVLGPTGAPDCPDRPDCPLKTSGRHTIVVKDMLGKATGDYTLYLQRTDDPAGCGSISIGEAAEGTLQPAGSMACAAFTATGGERVQISVVPTAAGAALVFPEVNVLRVDQGTSACLQQDNCPLDQPGRYVVLAAGAKVDNQTGPYRITVTCLAGPCRSG